jgi:ribonuclease D
MMEYAASDVYYLIPLAKMLQQELRKKARSSWVDEECLYLSRVRPPSPNSEPLYTKFKGAGRLEPRGLAVLDALLDLRDKIAAKKDRPHYKILGNQALKKIAALKCADLKQLEGTRVLSRKQIGMYGNEIRAAVCRALSIPDSRLPVYPHKPSAVLSRTDRKRMKTIRRWRDRKAEGLGLDPSILFSKAQLVAIAQINPRKNIDLDRIQEIKNWQRKTFGGEIMHVLKKGSGEGHR